MKNLRHYEKFESMYLDEKEEKEELKEKLKATDALGKENDDLKEELEEMKIRLDSKADEDELAEAVATNNKIQKELVEKKRECEEMQAQLQQYMSVSEQLETKMSEQHSKYCQELQKKEASF